MTDEENNEVAETEAAEPAAEAPADASASAEDSAPTAQQETATATEEAKPKRSRATKPKAETEASAEPEGEEPEAETATEAKPKRTRAAKPKAETAKAETAKATTSKAQAAKAEKPKKAESKSKPGRRERHEPVDAPVVRAQAKYVRSSARKARLVCDNIRGKSVEDARAILAHTPRAVARDWSKLLESAIANAEHNHELVGEDLFIKAVSADEGPTIKRFRPRAMGRASKIRKRTAHLTILLTPKN
jgi:ribosomal protein L22